MSHLSDDLVAWIKGWLPPPPARVLDVGCGAGDSTRWLRGAGFEAMGIDPRAPAEDGFLRLPLEALPADSRFDGALAIRSLHHVHGLEEGLDRLHAALAPRGRLVLFEFAVENADAAARRWLEARGLEPKLAREDQVTSLGDLRAAIERRFRLLAFEPATYLARDFGHEELAGEEEEAVRRGALKPIGARLAYQASTGA